MRHLSNSPEQPITRATSWRQLVALLLLQACGPQLPTVVSPSQSIAPADTTDLDTAETINSISPGIDRVSGWQQLQATTNISDRSITRNSQQNLIDANACSFIERLTSLAIRFAANHDNNTRTETSQRYHQILLALHNADIRVSQNILTRLVHLIEAETTGGPRLDDQEQEDISRLISVIFENRPRSSEPNANEEISVNSMILSSLEIRNLNNFLDALAVEGRNPSNRSITELKTALLRRRLSYPQVQALFAICVYSQRTRARLNLAHLINTFANLAIGLEQ